MPVLKVRNEDDTAWYSLSGDQGAEGPQGDQGDQGAAGDQGAEGPQGDQGDQGAAGDQGAEGPQGDQGDQGAAGDQGAEGPQGDQGDQGAAGDQGAEGPQGDQGDQGAAGDQGAEGPQGDQGDQGAAGDQGAEGPQGDQGDQGAAGDQGAEGPQGDQGDQGAAGDQGAEGPQGDQGDQGAAGDQGAEGPQGDQGDQGAAGDSFWQRAGTVISPINAGDDLDMGTGKISADDLVINTTGLVSGGGATPRTILNQQIPSNFDETLTVDEDDNSTTVLPTPFSLVNRDDTNDNMIGMAFKSVNQASAAGEISGVEVGAVFSAHSAAAFITADLIVLTSNNDAVPTEKLRIISTGELGLGEIAPETFAELTAAEPYITLHNETEEDTDYGRESRIIFKGEQSGGEESTLGLLEFAHDDTSDDQKGIFSLKVNSGTDDDAPPTVLTVLANGYVGIGIDTPAAKMHVVNSGSPAAEIFEADCAVNPPNQLVIRGATDNEDLLLIGVNTNNHYASIQAYQTDPGYPGVTTNLFLSGQGSNVGIGGYTAAERLTVHGAVLTSSSAPYVTLHNSTEEDTDYGRESRVIFKGEQSGAEETTLGVIEIAHDGTSDDEKGIFSLKLNSGAEGDAPSKVVTVDSIGNVGIGTTSPAARFDVDGRMRVLSKAPATPASGKGLELFYDATADAGTVLSYDRSGSTYERIRVHGSDIVLGIDGSMAGKGLWIDNNGNVGIGKTTPATLVELTAALVPILSLSTVRAAPTVVTVGRVAFGNGISSGYYSSVEGYRAGWDDNVNLIFKACYQGSVEVIRIKGINSTTFRVGILTTAPAAPLDVNQGSGNMIADGYDTHSLAAYKENVAPVGSVLGALAAVPVYEYRREPYVSADELRVAVIEEFGKERWMAAFGGWLDENGHVQDDAYREGALRVCSDQEMLVFINTTADALRAQRRTQDRWIRKHYGLVADDPSVVTHAPELLSYDDSGEPIGVSLADEVGFLHAALQQLLVEHQALAKVVQERRA